jgi:hypothetical protein
VESKNRLHQNHRFLLQAVLEKAAAFAVSAGDEVYLQRAQQQRNVLLGLRTTADAYLREHLRGIAAASSLNARFKERWEKTPPVSVPMACWCLTSV